MKKIVFSLIACFAFIQSAQAITSILGESLNEYLTLANAIDTKFMGTISENELITDIRRQSTKTTFSKTFEVHYLIRTFLPRSSDLTADVNLDTLEAHHHSHPRNKKIHLYDALLSISPDPTLLGPPVVTVVSITPICSKTKTFFGHPENSFGEVESVE